MSDVPGRVINFENRTVERGRGCWNCTGFLTGEQVLNHVRDVRKAEEADKILKGMMSPTNMNDPRNKAFNKSFDEWEALAKSGEMGMCLRGGTDATFVEMKFLCHKWVGREGSSMATEGKPMDMLPDELKSRMDEGK